MLDDDSITVKNLYVPVPENYDEDIVISKVRRTKETKPAFMTVGNGFGSKRRGSNSMNYTKMLLGLGKPAGFLFDLIMDGRLPYVNSITGITSTVQFHNVAVVNSKEFSSTEKQYVTKGYKELLEKGMVVRQARGRYVINPRLVISGNEWADEEKLYQSLIRREEENKV